MAYASGAIAQDATLQRIADALETQSGSSEIIAPKEASSVSTRAYAIGKQFIYDGKLYKATAAIAIGDTIVTEGVGANCTESDSITEQIDDIAGVVGSTALESGKTITGLLGSTTLDTAYGATLTAQMANLKSYNTYSTSETWTGKYWIDGKKIYQKVVNIPDQSTANSRTELSVQDLNIDTPIGGTKGMAIYNNTIKYALPLNLPTGGINDATGGFRLSQNEVIFCSYNWTNKFTNIYAVIEYTKTT